MPSFFQQDLEKLINRHGLDADLNTPDFILASYLNDCLYVFETAVKGRDQLTRTKEVINEHL